MFGITAGFLTGCIAMAIILRIATHWPPKNRYLSYAACGGVCLAVIELIGAIVWCLFRYFGYDFK